MAGLWTPRLGDAGASAPSRAVQLPAIGIGIAIAVMLLELTLRTVPQIISPKLLILFEPTLRERIAAGSYPLQKDHRRIERDDGGPPLYVAKPGSRIVAIDEAAGGALRFNDEAGFCNPPGTWRAHERMDVVVLGDSLTWCHGVLPQQAWPARLGTVSGAAVLSLARGGTGLYEHIQQLREFGLAKRPRVVVMGIYGGNDLRDAARLHAYRDAVGKGLEPPSDVPRQVAPYLVASAVGRHSYALNLVLALASRIASKASDWERSGIDFHYEVALPGGAVPFNVDHRDRDEVVSARRLAEGSTSLALWQEPMERFAAMAREHGFTAVVAYLPSAHVAYAGRIRWSDPTIAPGLERFDDEQRRWLEERSASLGLVFHDLTADLRGAAVHETADGLLYDPAHLHLSVRGNDVVAASVARLLERQRLLASN